MVDFQLIFETKVTSTEALAPLKKVTADGKLGSLKVDSSSLKLRIVDKPGNNTMITASNLFCYLRISKPHYSLQNYGLLVLELNQSRALSTLISFLPSEIIRIFV